MNSMKIAIYLANWSFDNSLGNALTIAIQQSLATLSLATDAYPHLSLIRPVQKHVVPMLIHILA
jgi:hypothetical protein